MDAFSATWHANGAGSRIYVLKRQRPDGLVPYRGLRPGSTRRAVWTRHGRDRGCLGRPKTTESCGDPDVRSLTRFQHVLVEVGCHARYDSVLNADHHWCGNKPRLPLVKFCNHYVRRHRWGRPAGRHLKEQEPGAWVCRGMFPLHGNDFLALGATMVKHEYIPCPLGDVGRWGD